MAVVAPLNIPQVTQVNSDSLAIVGFAVTLSQAEVPYTIVTDGPLAASQTDLMVYGDTVTIVGDLVNPGRTIAIYARQILIGTTAFISVSGADPDQTANYVPGIPAKQTDVSPGAAGANGSPGSTGLKAGSIILMAESIQANQPDTGAGSAGRMVCLRQLWNTLAVPAYENSVGQATVPLTGLSVPVLTIVDATAGDVQHPSGFAVTSDQTGSYSLLLTFNSVTFACTANYTFEGKTSSVPVQGTFSLTASVPAVPQGSGGPAPVLTIAGLHVTANGAVAPIVNDAVQDALNLALPTLLPQELNTILQPALNACSNAASNAVSSPQNGSTLSLTLSAVGGTGGRGEDGHAGVVGSTGARGQDTTDVVNWSAPAPPQCIGGTGGPGGQGGNAGTSGSGGVGGTVTLNLIQTPSFGVSGYSDGGLGGPPAVAGVPGAGGNGGAGGTYETTFISGPPSKAVAPGGQPGSPGAAASSQGAPGATGNSGSALFNGVPFGQTGSFAYGQIAPSLSLYQLLFEQQANKLAYLNAQSASDYQNVISLYLWLQAVTQPFSVTPPPTNTGLSATDIATRAAIYQSVTLELTRLNLNLDYFGDPFNWVPVLTYSALDAFVSELIQLGENVLTQYQNSSQPSQQQIAAQNASQSIKSNLGNITNYEGAVEAQITALDGQITALGKQMSNQVSIIENAISDAQAQYNEQQTGCSFAQVLSAVSSIVQLGLSEFQGVEDLTTSLAIEGAGANLIQGGQNLVVQAIASSSDYSSISGAWTSLQSTLQKYPNNSGLIMVADQQFDNLLQQYLDGLPEASEVEDDVNELISLIQARNQALLNYTSQYTQLQRLQTQYTQKSAELQNIAALLAAEQQPQLPDYLAFLQGSLTEIGNNIVDALYLANQAFQYWSALPQQFSVAGIDMASLSMAVTNMHDNVLSYLNGTARPFSKFPPQGTQGMTYTVNRWDEPVAFADMDATGVLVLQLSVDDPANPFTNYYNVTVETVSIALPGIAPVPTPNNSIVLQLTLTQLGPDVVEGIDANGNVSAMTFTHAPRPVPYEFNYTTNQITVQGTIGDSTQGFTGLSPFAIWTIDFTSSENSWLTVSKINTVVFDFTGQLLGETAGNEQSIAHHA